MRHKASHAEVGDHQDSGSQLANRQDLGRIHCRTVGHTQNLPVEGSVTTWTISNKVLNNTEAEDVKGWTGVQPRREGAWRKPKPPGRRKKKTSFLFCTGLIVW